MKDLLGFKNYVNHSGQVSFYLGAIWKDDILLSSSISYIIKLDEEDLEYFKKKYLPMLKDELNDKINKLKKDYGIQ